MSKTFSDILSTRLNRRNFVKITSSSLLFAGMASAKSIDNFLELQNEDDKNIGLQFSEILPNNSQDITVAKGYNAQVLIKWGDQIGENVKFGYNNDFIAYMPIDDSSNHGLLCVNHEYASAELMFPDGADRENISKDRAIEEMQSHGHSVIEIIKKDNDWQYKNDSKYNRRIDCFTKMDITGPVKGSERLKTSYDKGAIEAIGTLGNCSGGITPWKTILFAEENFNYYFSGTPTKKEKDNYFSLSIGKKDLANWKKFYDRFDINKENNEANRFGWMIEYDPYDPHSKPKKRTALGRFKHEAASIVRSKSGKAVVYMGDDANFEYLYKFVSKDKINNDSKNENLLDEGVLHVAKFNEDGSLEWIPLLFGNDVLNEKNDFFSQSDVLIETRRAAKLMGATAMDRPEDVQVNPVNNKIYVVLTNNYKRLKVNPANPRRFNAYGHILELSIRNDDHEGNIFDWNIFIMARGEKFANPDNIAFDNVGNIWIATDGSGRSMKINDGLYAAATTGSKKSSIKRFFSGPVGCEICGPEFTPDNKTLFLSIQHPGEGSTYNNPSTRWPEFNDDIPPKPAVVAITKRDGGVIGS